METHIKTAIIQPPPPDPYPATHGIAWIPQLTIIWEVVNHKKPTSQPSRTLTQQTNIKWISLATTAMKHWNQRDGKRAQMPGSIKKVKKCNSYCISTAFFYPVHTRTAVDKQLFHSIRQDVQACGRTKQIKGGKKRSRWPGTLPTPDGKGTPPFFVVDGDDGVSESRLQFFFGYGEKLNWKIVKIPHNQKKKPYKF